LEAGKEITMLIHLNYSAAPGQAHPNRLVSSLADWNITDNGEFKIYPANSQPHSACPWIIYSPAQMTVMPGKVNSIRVTIAVPKETPPGEYLAMLLVQPRAASLKFLDNSNNIMVNFRLGAIIYVMVPSLTSKGCLKELTASANENGVTVMPTLSNQGNSHLRPTHSIRIEDQAGKTVVNWPTRESTVLLGGAQMCPSLFINQSLPAGKYRVTYRIDFNDGGNVIDGQTNLYVEDCQDEKLAAQP
jgi:hypothetical protein